MQKYLLITACLLGALAVVSGAFGAHGLRTKLSIDQLAVYETAVRYLFFHVLAIIVSVLISRHLNSSLALYGAVAFIIGIVLFSGSLFLLSTKTLLGLESWRWLGPVTPIGGLSFIVGWVLLAIACFQWK